MRNTCCAALFLVLVGCEKPQVAVKPLPTPEPTPEATPTPTPALKPSLAPPVPATPIATPQTQVTPSNDLYLSRRVSISTDGGIRGFDAGTKLQIISRQAEKLTVAVEGMQFEVAASDTTNDVEVVKALIPQVKAIDAAVAQKKVLTAQEVEQQKLKRDEEFKQMQASKENAARQQRLNELPKLIAQAETRKKQLYYYVQWIDANNPKTPENRARLQEYEQLGKAIQDMRNELGRLNSLAQ